MSYIDQIIGDDRNQVRFSSFARSIDSLDADVLHVSQAVRLLEGQGSTGDERADRARKLVGKLRSRHIPLVQTMHGAHQGASDRWRQIIDDATSVFISLDETMRTPDARRTVVIPHAHYRDRFVGYPRAEQVPGRILAISPTNLVKVAAGPLKIFRLLNTTDASLRVMGQSHPSLTELLERVLGRYPQSVSAQIGLASDAMMIKEISAAELVILPSDASLLETSMLMLTLSVGRPVLMPKSASSVALAEEIGPGWIHHHDGALTAERLDDVMAAVRDMDRAEQPNLDARDPETIASRYAEIYRSVVTPAA